MNILHLSDLHFGSVADATNWYSQIADDLTYELRCPSLDLLIISGDIANKSITREYSAAEQLIKSLCKDFHLSSDQLVIVPGNHDLNWTLAKKSYTPRRRENYKGPLTEEGVPDPSYSIEKGEFIEVQNPERYKNRFKYFSEFYQAVTGKPYPLEYSEQAILYPYPEHKLLILGLNSAWQLDHHYKSRAGINPNAISNTLTEIRQHPEIYGDWLKFSVWHHPISSSGEDRITDANFLQRLAQSGFCIGMHGHIHKADTNLYRYDMSPGGRKLEIICAGTFGAPTREWTSGYPLQYNLLKLQDNKLIVETRARRELNGAWKPDAIWTQGQGRDPLPRYEIQLPNFTTRHSPPETISATIDPAPILQPPDQTAEHWTQTIPSYEEESPPLKTVLIVAVSPKNLSRIHIDKEVREICNVLWKARKVQFNVEILRAARVEDLSRALLEFAPQIIHFCGHGSAEGIFLENDIGEAHPVSPETLAGIFDLFSSSTESIVETIFFNACYTENQANAVAPYAKHIIGTKKAIGDDDAITLATCFYEALASGRSYNFAYEYALRVTKAKGTIADLETTIRITEQHTDLSSKGKTERFNKNVLSAKRILFLSASPLDSSQIRVDEEIRDILIALRTAINSHEVIIQQRCGARFEDFHQGLLDFKPQIVHFSGHGSRGGLVFEHESGSSQIVKSETIARLLDLFPGQVECVLLNANYSGRMIKNISKRIPFVIGVASAILDQEAIAFARGFYQALGSKSSFENAFKSGNLQCELVTTRKRSPYRFISLGKV